MRHALLLIALLLAGCAQSPSPEPEPIEPGPDQDAASFAAEGCPLAFPDGQSMACDAAEWTEPTSAQPPAVTDGWRCTRDYTDDYGNVFQMWGHVDGRSGAYFEGTPWKDNGVVLFSVQMYTADGGSAALVPHQPTAFVELPEMPSSGRLDVHLIFSQLRLFERLPGQEWHDEPEGAGLLAATFGGHPWFVWEVPKDNGTFYLSHMQADPDPQELAAWKARDRQAVAPDGSEYIADSFGSGIKFLGRDAPEYGFTGPGTCQVT